MNPAYNALNASRLTRIIEALQYKVDLPQELFFLKKTPVVNASDQEITARWFVRAQIADIIADDAQALVYNFSRFTTETTNLPNLKLGVNLTQQQINMLEMLRQQGANVTTGGNVLEGFYQRMFQNLLLGIRQREETLIIAAHIDQFSYNRFGVILNGVTFGVPADLKPTVSTYWDNAAAATPVSDIFTVQQIGRQRYGVDFDRLIMSTTAFQYMTQTTDFQNRVRLFFNANPNITAAAIGVTNVQDMLKLAAPALRIKEIVLYDARYWSQDTTGNVTSTRFMPVNVVIMDSTQNDGDPLAMDLANGVTTESIVSQLVPTSVIGNLPAGRYGPIAYATPSKLDMNPPGLTAWAAARAWPRRFRQQMNAAITVGTFTDTIPSGAPFPIS